MKHAGAAALAELNSLLDEIRRLPGLQERKPGIFYRRGQAFLHFHEDPAGLFADAKLAGTKFERLSVQTADQRQGLLHRLRQTMNV
ncbi:hypothetical protein ACFJGW_07215 [Burkholderiaceae bacterium UC74_6]